MLAVEVSDHPLSDFVEASVNERSETHLQGLERGFANLIKRAYDS
jgi:hypothetical protein